MKSAFLLSTATLLLLAAFPSAWAVNVGDKAPEFTAKIDGGGSLSLSDYKGKWVVMYFYPKSDTPGCTKQACSLRDGYQALLDEKVVVIGVSTDDVPSQDRFKQKYALPFNLIADEKQEVTKAYGVLVASRSFAQRKTFIIDPDGQVVHIFSKVNVNQHDDEVLARIKALKAKSE